MPVFNRSLRVQNILRALYAFLIVVLNVVCSTYSATMLLVGPHRKHNVNVTYPWESRNAWRFTSLHTVRTPTLKSVTITRRAGEIGNCRDFCLKRTRSGRKPGRPRVNCEELPPR